MIVIASYWKLKSFEFYFKSELQFCKRTRKQISVASERLERFDWLKSEMDFGNKEESLRSEEVYRPECVAQMLSPFQSSSYYDVFLEPQGVA